MVLVLGRHRVETRSVLFGNAAGELVTTETEYDAWAAWGAAALALTGVGAWLALLGAGRRAAAPSRTVVTTTAITGIFVIAGALVAHAALDDPVTVSDLRPPGPTFSSADELRLAIATEAVPCPEKPAPGGPATRASRA